MRLDGEVCTYSLARSVKVSFSIVARLERKKCQRRKSLPSIVIHLLSLARWLSDLWVWKKMFSMASKTAGDERCLSVNPPHPFLSLSCHPPPPNPFLPKTTCSHSTLPSSKCFLRNGFVWCCFGNVCVCCM